jgi:glutamine amidotransferase
MQVSILDIGAGNLHSLAKAVERAGASVVIEADPDRALRSDVLVLPGVGSFPTAAESVFRVRDQLAAVLLEGKPCLAVCVGMQLLFTDSEEGEGLGLGIIAGRVTRLAARSVPQMGWNTLVASAEPLVTAAGLDHVYYANSFAGRPVDRRRVTAWSDHEGDAFPAIVRVGRTVGVQFHPEKSSVPGIAFIAAFLAEVVS